MLELSMNFWILWERRVVGGDNWGTIVVSVSVSFKVLCSSLIIEILSIEKRNGRRFPKLCQLNGASTHKIIAYESSVYLPSNPSVISFLTCFGSFCSNWEVLEVSDLSEWTEERVDAFNNVDSPAATKFRDCDFDRSIHFLIGIEILCDVNIPVGLFKGKDGGK